MKDQIKTADLHHTGCKNFAAAAAAAAAAASIQVLGATCVSKTLPCRSLAWSLLSQQ
jgi:hypothetical protein